MQTYNRNNVHGYYSTVYENLRTKKDAEGNIIDPTYSAPAGYNGLTGFKKWECYMLVKFGNNGNFNKKGDDQYLLELPLYPDQVTESISAEWATQKVLGRSAPLSAYAGTSLKSVNFSLDLHRGLLTGSFSLDENEAKALGFTGNRAYTNNTDGYPAIKDYTQLAGHQKQTAAGPFATRTWYVNANKMFQIACYPQYTSKGLVPPTTYFVFGQMILKGYITSYQTEWKKPIINTFYGWNSVSISMECYPDSIISAKDIITNNKTGTASTQNTYNTKYPSNVNMNSNVMNRSDTMNRSNARTVAAGSANGTPRRTSI